MSTDGDTVSLRGNLNDLFRRKHVVTDAAAFCLGASSCSSQVPGRCGSIRRGSGHVMP